MRTAIFHLGPRGYGQLLTWAGIGALTAAVLLTGLGHRWRLGRAAMTGAFLFPIAMIAVSRAPFFHFALGCLFFSGLGLMLFNAVSNSMLQTAPPNELRGRVMSLRAFVFAGLAPFGALQIGAVAQWLGVRTALSLSAGACAVAAVHRGVAGAGLVEGGGDGGRRGVVRRLAAHPADGKCELRNRRWKAHCRYGCGAAAGGGGGVGGRARRRRRLSLA